MRTIPPQPGSGAKPKRKWPWYRPVVRNWRRYYLRQFPRKKKLHGTFLHRLLGNRLFDPGLWLPTRETVAWGMVIGTFIGMMPFFGLQIAFSVVLCFMFRVNVTAAVLATFISNPLTGPGILYLQYLIGKAISTPPDPAELEGLTKGLKLWVISGKPLMIGAAITGVGAAVLAYPITLLIWSGVSKAAGKAITVVHHAKKHGHDAHPDQGTHGDQAAHGGEGPSGGEPPATHAGFHEDGLGLAGGPFPEKPSASDAAKID